MQIGYNDEAALTAYATARGVTLEQDASVLLTRALDWLELQPFKGSKTDEEQPLEFPRNGASVVPAKIATAQLVAAMRYNEEDLLEAVGPQVTQETVVGAVSVSYSDRGGSSAVSYPQLEALLRDYVDTGSGNFFDLV
ncbi:MAG TPA: DnaT-like ssDNA-binding protein [Pseudomonadales bacterium]|nr:DnaT-like ssDNA-binding protein [Pseudomonadales bacterium]